MQQHTSPLTPPPSKPNEPWARHGGVCGGEQGQPGPLGADTGASGRGCHQAGAPPSTRVESATVPARARLTVKGVRRLRLAPAELLRLVGLAVEPPKGPPPNVMLPCGSCGCWFGSELARDFHRARRHPHAHGT